MLFDLSSILGFAYSPAFPQPDAVGPDTVPPPTQPSSAQQPTRFQQACRRQESSLILPPGAYPTPKTQHFHPYRASASNQPGPKLFTRSYVAPGVRRKGYFYPPSTTEHTPASPTRPSFRTPSLSANPAADFAQFRAQRARYSANVQEHLRNQQRSRYSVRKLDQCLKCRVQEEQERCRRERKRRVMSDEELEARRAAEAQKLEVEREAQRAAEAQRIEGYIKAMRTAKEARRLEELRAKQAAEARRLEELKARRDAEAQRRELGNQLTEKQAADEAHNATVCRRWKEYLDHWAQLMDPDGAPVANLPCPQLPSHSNVITKKRLETFLMHPAHSEGKSRKARIGAELLKWHPDKTNRWIHKLREDGRKQALEAAGQITIFLMEMQNELSATRD